MAYLLDNSQNNTNNSGQQDQLLNNGVPQTSAGSSSPSGQSSSAGSSAGAGSGGGGLQSSSSSLPARQGSGRFTNLQQYIGANQGAGSNISNSVQKNINSQVSQNQQAATKDTDTGQSNVSAGNALIAQGQNFQNQMSSPTWTPDQATQFAQNQDNVKAVNNLETGTAINGQALNQQNQQALNSTANYQQQANQFQQLGQTGQGQQQLLNQTYGGQYKPVYSQGQGMLDSLLLQGSPGSLGNLQSAIAGINTNAKQLADQAGNQTSAIQNLGTQQSALGQQLQNTTNQNVTGFENNLQGQVAGINSNLDAQTKSANEFLDFNNQALSDADFQTKYGTSKASYGGNQDMFNQLGLKNNEQTFNVFDNPNLNLSDIAKVNTERAQTWQDIANQQNVNQYQALAQLANTNPDNYVLTKPGSAPTTAYTLNTGDNSLQGQIDAARQAFLKQAQGTTVSDSNSWIQGIKGTGSVNLGNLVNDYGNIFNSGALGMQFTHDGSNYWGNGAEAYNPALAPGYTGNSPASPATPTSFGHPVMPGGQTRLDTINADQDNQNNNGAINQLAGPGMKAAGSYIGGGIGSVFGPVGTIAGSMVGGAVGNVAHSAIAPVLGGIASALGGNSGDDAASGEWWATHQTEGRNQEQFNSSDLAHAALNKLASMGFGNYINEGSGVQTAALNNLNAIGRFGYGQPVPTAGPSIGATTVPNLAAQGIYQPTVVPQKVGTMVMPNQATGRT